MTGPEPNDRRFVIGVTGNIACGKSTVVGMLSDLGAVTIDADDVYHTLIRPGEPLWHALRDRFGTAIISSDNTIERRALGAIVFTDPAALAHLDALTHPAVVAAIRAQVSRIADGVVVIDAVKLVESGLDAGCDALWVVICNEEQQIARLMARSNLSREEAVRRVRSQPDLEPKLARSDAVIRNDGTRDATRRQVERAWHAHVRPLERDRLHNVPAPRPSESHDRSG